MKLSTIRSTLAELDLRPSKSLGQNFLHDQNLAEWMVSALELEPADFLLEIGPGLGALTEFALPRCRGALLIEKDRRLAGFLQTRFANPEVTVLNQDATKFDARNLFPKMPVKVLGNLPYSITSRMLFSLTAKPSPVTRLVFTIQREFALRVAASPGNKDYGALTLLVQRAWRVQYLRTLPRTVFLPEPKVDSAVISLEPRAGGEIADCDAAGFDALVKQGFSQRRKQVRKLLAASIPDWPAAAEAVGVPETARAEELDLQQWIALARRVKHPGPPETDALHGSSPRAPAGQDVHGEIFDVVDKEDRVVGKASRHEVHTGGLLHRAVHIFVFNAAGELFLQKRSRWKDVHPSLWDSSAAGHVNTGQGYAETAAREIREELGVDAPLRFVTALPASVNTGFEFVHLFRGVHEGPFRLAPGEIETGGFFPLEIVKEWIQARPGDFASGFLECFRLWEAGKQG